MRTCTANALPNEQRVVATTQNRAFVSDIVVFAVKPHQLAKFAIMAHLIVWRTR